MYSLYEYYTHKYVIMSYAFVLLTSVIASTIKLELALRLY